MAKKKEIIPKDTRYVPVVQQKYCCVPACFQMVMIRRRVPLVSQELMAHYMHVIVPKKYGKLFWNVRTTTKKIKGGYGTQLNEDLTADPMFKKLNIPLRMGWKLVDAFETFEDFKKCLKTCIAKGQDVIVCYSFGKLFNDDYLGGHVSMLDRVYPSREEVRIIDPGAGQPKWRIVKMKKLYKAMQYHGKDNMAGFWEIRLPKKKS